MMTKHARWLKPGCEEYRPRTTFADHSTVQSGDVSPVERVSFQKRAFYFHSTSVDFLFYPPGRQALTAMSANEKKTVRIEDENDRWRFTCPRGHRDWEPTNHHFWCAKCARLQGIDGVFHQLRDRKTGMLYDRTDVQLLTPLGPYDRDLDQEGRV